jgi:hypothetical protein
MAEVATPVMDGAAADKKKVVLDKPEKPDEATYKENLAKAEKEHQASMKKLVRHITKSEDEHVPAKTIVTGYLHYT